MIKFLHLAFSDRVGNEMRNVASGGETPSKKARFRACILQSFVSCKMKWENLCAAKALQYAEYGPYSDKEEAQICGECV